MKLDPNALMIGVAIAVASKASVAAPGDPIIGSTLAQGAA